MAEYIEREAVLDYIDHMPSELTSDGRRMIRRIRLTEYISDSIPAADVAPVRHGKWERKADPYGFFDTIPVCSVCDCTTKWREEYLYCPNCGAKMDIPAEEGE